MSHTTIYFQNGVMTQFKNSYFRFESTSNRYSIFSREKDAVIGWFSANVIGGICYSE